MSITNTIDQLKTILAAVQNPNDAARPPRAVGVREFVAPADFPLFVIGIAPNSEFAMSSHGGQESRHDYELAIWLHVGITTTPLAELHARCEKWPQVVADALFAHLTLNGAVSYTGYQDQDRLFTWQMQPVNWGGNETYWGIKFILPVTEKQGQVMSA